MLWSCPGFQAGRGAFYTSSLLGTSWDTSSRTSSPNPVLGGRFGSSLALDSNTVAVSQYGPSNVSVFLMQIVPVQLKPNAYVVFQTLSFGSPVSFANASQVQIGVALRGNALGIATYGKLSIYSCTVPKSAAGSLVFSFGLFVSALALVLLQM